MSYVTSVEEYVDLITSRRQDGSGRLCLCPSTHCCGISSANGASMHVVELPIASDARSTYLLNNLLCKLGMKKKDMRQHVVDNILNRTTRSGLKIGAKLHHYHEDDYTILNTGPTSQNFIGPEHPTRVHGEQRWHTSLVSTLASKVGEEIDVPSPPSASLLGSTASASMPSRRSSTSRRAATIVAPAKPAPAPVLVSGGQVDDDDDEDEDEPEPEVARGEDLGRAFITDSDTSSDDEFEEEVDDRRVHQDGKTARCSTQTSEAHWTHMRSVKRKGRGGEIPPGSYRLVSEVLVSELVDDAFAAYCYIYNITPS